MATLNEVEIADLLIPYLHSISPDAQLYHQLSAYLDLLLKWNARTNLTAIRDPEEIVRRHFGESLFAGVHLARVLPANATLLDFGSGAGFPGLPIQLLLPELRVTVAESQGKKASFLYEAVRLLRLPTQVWARRVEEMPPGRTFTAVTLRAVDDMQQALAIASSRVSVGGWLLTLASGAPLDSLSIPLPESTQRHIVLNRMTRPVA